MKFQTLIQDGDGKEWCFEGEVVGRCLYTDEGEISPFVIEGFNIIDISIFDEDVKFLDITNINQMPDRFSERAIRCLIQDAEREFIEDWIDVQECAASRQHDFLNEAN